MFWNKKQQLSTEDIKSIISDFNLFYDTEYKFSIMQQIPIEDSTIVNIAVMDNSFLITDKGQAKMLFHFNSNSMNQKLGKRLKTFYASCIIKYGSSVMEMFVERCLLSLVEAYELPATVVMSLANKSNTFWTLPLFRRAFDSSLIFSIAETQEEK